MISHPYCRVDLAVYPHEGADESPAENEEFTIGDLHGNCIKLIFFLIKSGIMQLAHGEEDYQKLFQIYESQRRFFRDTNNGAIRQSWQIYNRKRVELSREQLTEFKEIIRQASFKKVSMVRLIGDEFCDRGNSDLLTLAVFDELRRQKVPYSIEYSNHGILAINAFLNLMKEGYYYVMKMGCRQENSLISTLASLGIKTKCYYRTKNKKFSVASLRAMFSTQVESYDDPRCTETNKRSKAPSIITKEEFLKEVERAYYPALRLVDYSFTDNNDRSIFVHGLVGVNVVEEAIKLINQKIPGSQLEYKDATPLQTAKTFDELNESFSKIVHSGRLDEVYVKSDVNNPIYKLLWSRNASRRERFETIAQSPEPFTVVHGHVGEYYSILEVHGREVNKNLDTGLGHNQYNEPNKGNFLVRVEKVSKLTVQCRKFYSLKQQFAKLAPDLMSYTMRFYDESLSDEQRDELIDNMSLQVALMVGDENECKNNGMAKKFERLKRELGFKDRNSGLDELNNDFYGSNSKVYSRQSLICYLENQLISQQEDEYGNVDQKKSEVAKCLNEVIDCVQREAMAKKIQMNYRTYRERSKAIVLIGKIEAKAKNPHLSKIERDKCLDWLHKVKKETEDNKGNIERLTTELESYHQHLKSDLRRKIFYSNGNRMILSMNKSHNFLIALSRPKTLIDDYATLASKKIVIQNALNDLHLALSAKPASPKEQIKKLNALILASAIVRNGFSSKCYSSKTNSAQTLTTILKEQYAGPLKRLLENQTINNHIEEVVAKEEKSSSIRYTRPTS